MLRGFHVALVEDDEIMGASLAQRLELEGARVLWMKQAVRALGALRTPRTPIDAVVCDIRLPDGDGEELFSTLCATTTPPPFLFITGHGGVEQAVRLMHAGAVDYVTKPFEMAVFLDRLSGLLSKAPKEEFPRYMGVSEAARRVEALVLGAARNDRSALIIGGPGTGKGLIARRIHEYSDRRAAPFVTVNLAREADPAGAFLAPGGALDRVGEGVLYIHALSLLPETVCAVLLEALERGFAGRIIASCGHEIDALRAGGGLQAELIYRLDMLAIPVPPLSERPEDAVWLMFRLFGPLNARRHEPLEGISRLSEEAVRAHDWPGGGRELRARLAQGISIAPGPLLQPADLFPERLAGKGMPLTLAEAREAAERRHIIEVLDQCGGQVGKAARILKVSRTTLWGKMQKYGIGRDQG
jgi:DNA-binding NtrC family response regulator